MMAKAPVPEFNPFRAITPAATMGDFYRQPGMMSLPDTGLGQVADALRGLSPSINEFIGKQADAANQAQMTQGEIDAERLDAEQAREVSRGNFVKLEKDGVIPEGASPFRLAAMQQAVGKKTVETGLRDVLNQNIQRFSDPFNEEDPAAFVQDQFVEMTQGMGFYAQAAATDALDAVERNFLNRTSLLRAERTVEQNRNDFTSNGYQIFHADYDGSEFPVADMTKRLQESADEHYKNTGESGRDQLWQSVQAAAMAAARDGNIEDAEDYIAAFRDVVIQGKSLGESMDLQLDELSQRAAEADERAGNEMLEGLREKNAITQNAGVQAGQYVFSKLGQNGLRNADEGAIKEEALNYLRDELGLSEEDAQLASSVAVEDLTRLRRGGSMSEETREEYTSIVISDDLTKQQRIDRLRGIRSDLTDEEYFKAVELISNREDVDNNKREVENTTIVQSRVSISNNLVGQLAENAGIGPEATADLVSSFTGEVNAIIQEEAQKEGSADERSKNVVERIKALTRTYTDNIREITEEVSEDAPEAVRESIERQREIEMEEAAQPSILRTPGASWYWWDSLGRKNLETIQDENSSDKEKEKARESLYKNALDRRKRFKRIANSVGIPMGSDIGGATGTFKETLSDDNKGEELRMASITGFTLDEIMNLKTEADVDIPVDVLNPKHSVLVPGMTSVSDFDAFWKTEEGREKIVEIMEALPPQYRAGTDDEDVKNFVGLQRKLLNRYRPNNQVGDS
ncbi:MAG: hypothetical protein Unbinned1446contig1001_21 [Prokaryotic dsDNA virus sp.]|mgnify:CR=1 FL=1|nr:MAG: hypothetical protein Unbinned1446contig1001_21 [Prokaryotic dsDNA virus sp.]|tara:strand:- start:4804 stop:7038 length:2235 start_codon:yes stop_codon:yes gene_type:complete